MQVRRCSINASRGGTAASRNPIAGVGGGVTVIISYQGLDA